MTFDRLFDLFPATRGRIRSDLDDPLARRLRFELVVLVMTGLFVPMIIAEAVGLHGGRSWTLAVSVPTWFIVSASLGVAMLRWRPRLMTDDRVLAIFFWASSVADLALLWNFAGPRDPVWAGYIGQIVVGCVRWRVAGAVMALVPFYIGRVVTELADRGMSPADRSQEITLEFVAMTVVTFVIGFLFRELEISRARLSESALALTDSRAALEASATRLSTVLEHIAEAIITVDQYDVVTSANRATGDLFDCRPADLIGQTVASVLRTHHLVLDVSADGTGLDEGLTVHRHGTGRRPDGRELVIDLQTTTIPGDRGPIRVVLIRDVTAERAHTAALTHQALHDALTGLPNRQQFQDQLAARVATASADGEAFSVLLMDMDGFKDVNDALGHLIGDRLLQEVARRLRDTLRSGDLVARLGGDEFAVLPSGNASPEKASRIARNVLSALKEPFVDDGHVIETGMSIGIAHYPEHGGDGEALLRRADIAMYAAKRARRGWIIYAAPHGEGGPGDVHPYHVSELRRAVENDEFILHYQPVVNLGDGSLAYVEALIRWQHPERGLVEPDDFIPLAEQSDVIKPLARFVIDSALRQQQEWRRQGHEVPVSVNVSGRNVHDYQLPVMINSLIRRWGATAASLTLEIAENTTLSAGAVEALERLAGCGIGLAIDDYGAGHASLLHLRKLPLKELKMDRSLIRNLRDSGADVAVVRSTIGLAHALGLTVVAEGVEDAGTLTMLRELGCDAVQGFLLSRPLPAEALLAQLAMLGSMAEFPGLAEFAQNAFNNSRTSG